MQPCKVQTSHPSWRLVCEVFRAVKGFNLKSDQTPESEAVLKTVQMGGGLFLTSDKPYKMKDA